MKSSLVLIILAAFTAGCAHHRVVLRDQPTAPITENHKVHFDFGKKRIRVDDEESLRSIAETLKSDPKAVAILEGHADPIGGTRPNEVLAEERAREIRVRLRDYGVDPEQLTITSKGEREPIVKTSSKAKNVVNRRVEVYVTLIP